ESITGQGIRGIVDGHHIVVGNAPLIETLAVVTGEPRTKAEKLQAEGQMVMLVAVDGRMVGLIGVVDPIKPSTSEAIQALHNSGVRVVMLTGDSYSTATSVARKLGIDDVEAEVLPDRKRDVVVRLKSTGRRVAMAGDGINDAPALAQADVGLAMGTG